MFAILESHVAAHKLNSVCDRVFGRWLWYTNAKTCTGGTRKILGWDPGKVDMMVLSFSDQVIHAQLRIIAENKHLFCSFVYAGNRPEHRLELWANLLAHKRFVSCNPWCVLGDF